MRHIALVCACAGIHSKELFPVVFWRLGAIALGLLFGTAVFAQNVTVATGEWAGSGISLTPGGTPGFVSLANSAWAMSSAGVDATPLYPYSFILTNNSGHAIVAFSARWSATDSAGHATTRDSQSFFGSFDHGITTGQAHLVTPLTGLNGLTAPPSGSLGHLSAEISSVQRTFAGKSAITITLESVVLDDGLILGADKNNSIAQLRARLDSQKQLVTGILNAFNAGGQTAAVNYLETIAAIPGNGDPISASRQSSPDLAYNAFLALTEPRLARSYLGLAQNNPSLLMVIARKKSAQQIPTLHR